MQTDLDVSLPANIMTLIHVTFDLGPNQFMNFGPVDFDPVTDRQTGRQKTIAHEPGSKPCRYHC